LQIDGEERGDPTISMTGVSWSGKAVRREEKRKSFSKEHTM